jgi:hypothetical protein
VALWIRGDYVEPIDVIANSTKIVPWPCNGEAGQRWRLRTA